jgi:hypothetical protein
MERIISFAPDSVDWFKHKSSTAKIQGSTQKPLLSSNEPHISEFNKIRDEEVLHKTIEIREKDFERCCRPQIMDIDEENYSDDEISLRPNVSNSRMYAGSAVVRNSDDISIRAIRTDFLFKEDELLNENSQKFEKMIKKRGRKYSKNSRSKATPVSNNSKEKEKKKPKKKPKMGSLSKGLFASLNKKKKRKTSLEDGVEEKSK